MRSPHITMKSSPCSPQLEKAWVQWRPNAAKNKKNKKKNSGFRDFPGGLVVNTLCFHCRGCRYGPCLGNWDPTCCMVQLKKKQLGSSASWGFGWVHILSMSSSLNVLIWVVQFHHDTNPGPCMPTPLTMPSISPYADSQTTKTLAKLKPSVDL